MVSTRTQTGTIATKRYDITTLTLNASAGLASPTKSRSPKKPRKPRSPTTRTRPNPLPKPMPKPSRPSSSLGFSPGSDPDFASKMGLDAPPPTMIDVCEGMDVTFPSRAWGEKEEVGLSAIQRAERDVEVWESVLRCHVEGGFESLVPGLEMAVENAKEKLGHLREEERRGRKELGRAGVENPGAKAIEERLKALRWTLANKTKFDAEAENIRGAIAAYESGDIAYSHHFTILYAGKVVDTAPNYGAFVVDRQERLDRYAKAHGPHWLWYEPPLNVAPESRPQMLGSLALHRIQNYTNLGAWHINQGFWKRAGWVMRMAATFGAEPSLLEPNFLRATDGSVYCQESGPKQAFRSILDSGATFPSLYKADFAKLMIDEQNYAAQSVEVLNTANGVIYGRQYELFVSVLDEQQRQLVDENHCAHPYHAKYLGGLCPVVEAQGSLEYDAEGREVSTRLSGLVPFLACYVSSAPTRNTLFLGEDRKDVLGSHRVPGGRKWDIHLPTGPPPGNDEVLLKYGDPKTTFSHRDGKIVDEDDPKMDFASTITFMSGTPQARTIRNCPKEDMDAKREARKKEEESTARNQAATDELVRKKRCERLQQQGGGIGGPGSATANPRPSPWRENSEDPVLAPPASADEMDIG